MTPFFSAAKMMPRRQEAEVVDTGVTIQGESDASIH